MATLEELLAQARLDLDDPLFSDSDVDSRWKTTELIGYVNRAIDESCLRARLIEDTGDTRWGKIAVKTGKASYTLDSRVLRIRRAKLESETAPLLKTGYENLDFRHYDWENETGTPIYFMQDFGDNSLRLVPTPVADDNLILTVQRTQACKLTDDDLENEPEIPVQHHYQLLHYVYHLAYQRRDDDTYDPEQSTKHLGMFDMHFGPRPTAEDVEAIRREWPRRVRGRYV